MSYPRHSDLAVLIADTVMGKIIINENTEEDLPESDRCQDN
jgi:hypothetical protein